MRLQMFGGSDIGLVRSSNQDAIFFNADYGIAIVSDGMGGHKGGEIASALTVAGLRDAFLSSQQILVENLSRFLDEILGRINREIHDRANADERLHGMGATVNCLMFAGGELAIGHAGDSRTYLLRAGRRKDNSKCYGLWCLTVDHNVGTFIERGIFKEGRDFRAGTVNERQKARLTRGMGVVPDLKADVYKRHTQEGDVYLTCSDGLHGFASDSEILRAAASGPISTAHERLIDLAKSKGAPDNVTVVTSVLGEIDEPLLHPPAVELRNFMVRLQNGELRGPYVAGEIMQDWVRHHIPSDAEVCASLSDWVFLTDTRKLFAVYPEFNHPRIVDHLKSLRSDNVIAVAEAAPIGTAEHRRKMIFFGSLAAVTLLVIWLILRLSFSAPPTPIAP